jgi:hypothetical protein
MGIITQDWAIDYVNKTPVSLKQFGIDDDKFDTDDTVGYCDSACVMVNKSCGIGKYELQEFMDDVTKGKEEFQWTWLCLPAHYDIQDIVSVPEFAIPDLLYYWRFLWMFFNRRPQFGVMKRKTDFPNYYCYNKENRCEVKELLSHYWVIFAIGLILWLYSPLLVHYLPSSSFKKVHYLSSSSVEDEKMFPSYKSPVYFGRWVKSLLSFYNKEWYWIRGRRLAFLIAMALTCFRLLFYRPYCYYFLFLVVCTGLASLKPKYLSTYINAELPTHFFLWELPRDLVREKADLVEYQHLAHVMQERLYLSVDIRFWKLLAKKSFHSLDLLLLNRQETSVYTFVVLGFFALRRGCLIFTAAFIWNLVFYFIPLPYFCMELYRAVWKGTSQYIEAVRTQSSRSTWLTVMDIGSWCYTLVLLVFVTYTLIIIFIWCYAISEFTMFTFIGGALTVSTGYHYFVLVGAFFTAMYTLVRDLHEGYDRILKEMVTILKDQDTYNMLARQIGSQGNFALEKQQNPGEDEKFTISAKENIPSSSARKLLFHDGITTYINRDMFDFVVESCRPLRRQILFIIVKIIAIIFYSVIAMWVKNVYHMEEKVGSIFGMVQVVVVSFLPGLLQFLSYKSHFGKKTDIILKQDVYESLVKYIRQ